jgi:hypothetical protein
MRVGTGRAAAMALAVAILTVATPALAAKPPASKAAGPIHMESGAAWCIKPPVAPLVTFRGLPKADANTLASPALLYPAPTPAAFLAAVVTHAIIVGSVRAKHEKELTAAQDKVLEPYHPILASFDSEELFDRALDGRSPEGAKTLLCGAQPPASAWTLDSIPIFAMTQDQTGIVLDNLISLHPPGAPVSTVYHHLVRVVATPAPAPDPVAMWNASGGAKLKAVSVALFAQSLDIGLRLAAGEAIPADAPFKTVRYSEGGSERMERAQLLSDTCDRLVIRTLRGEFWSVPTLRNDCGAVSSNAAPAAATPTGASPQASTP